MIENNGTVLKFSRSSHIESSYDVAVIRLNNYSHIVGQPVLVRYYDDKHKVNSIVAIGTIDGPGKDHYTIISNGAIEPVTGAYDTRFPDVSRLVNDEVYLCYDNFDQPSYCIIKDNEKTFTPITEDKTVYSAMDGFFWFVTSGKIRRSDRPVDEELFKDILQELIDNGEIDIKETKHLVTWSDLPDGVVADDKPYAKIFTIPSNTSVIMAVFTQAPFGVYSVDIITFTNTHNTGVSAGSYNLTTRTKNFYIAKNGLTVEGIVKASVPSDSMYSTTYKFMVISSTCKEEEITWFSGQGYSGPVTRFSTIGSDVYEGTYNLSYDSTTGSASVNAREHNNIITLIPKALIDTTITTTFTEIPSGHNQFKFIIGRNIAGFVLKDAKGNTLVNIEKPIYAGSELTISRISGTWSYDLSNPDLFSSDGSIEINTTSTGGRDLSVPKVSGNNGFYFEPPTPALDETTWVEVLKYWYHDNNSNQPTTLLKLVFLNGTQTGFCSINNRILSFQGSFEFISTAKSYDFAFSINNGIRKLYMKPKKNSGLGKNRFEVVVINSQGASWNYGTKIVSTSGYPSYTTTDTIENYVAASFDYSTTDEVRDEDLSVVTSEGVYNFVKNEIKPFGDDIISLNEEIKKLGGNSINAVKSNGIVNENIDLGDGLKGPNLGNFYTPDNTRILTYDTEINGEYVTKGSFVYTDSEGREEVIASSTSSVIYQLTANKSTWYALGDFNYVGIIRVSLVFFDDEKVVGNIYCYGNQNFLTDNKTLSGYIVNLGDVLLIRGITNKPITITLEDVTRSFNFEGKERTFTSSTVFSTIPSNYSNYKDVAYCNASNPTHFTESVIRSRYVFVYSSSDSFVIELPKTAIPASGRFSTEVVLSDNKRNVTRTIKIKLYGNSNTEMTISNIALPDNGVITVTYNGVDLFYSVDRKTVYNLTSEDIGFFVESPKNRVTEINERSTHNQYPTAKAVWDKFKGKFSNEYSIETEFDSRSGYGYQAMLQVTTPAVVDVFWSSPAGTNSDTLYINGIAGKPSSYNIRCHNDIGVFSIAEKNGILFVCVPAKSTSSSLSTTYNFVTSVIGKCYEVSDLFFESTVPSTYVGQNDFDELGEHICEITSSVNEGFNFQYYDAAIITNPVIGGKKITLNGTFPNEEKIFHIVNSTGKDVELYIESENTNAYLDIPSVQAGANVTLVYVASEDRFTYDISLQSFISPRGTLIIEKTQDQWTLDISNELKSYWDSKQDSLTIDEAPVANSNNPVSSNGVWEAISAIQNTNYDDVPTSGSNNLVTSGTIYTALSEKQGKFELDNEPTSGSINMVNSGVIYTALSGKQNALNFDDKPTSGSSNPVKSSGIHSELSKKQATLTFDNTPTADSINPVTSKGILSALIGKQNVLTFDTTPKSASTNPVTSGGIYTALNSKQDKLSFDNVPTASSNNPVKSSGIYDALQKKTLVLTEADLTTRLFKIKSCTFSNPWLEEAKTKFNSDDYVLILDKEYDTILNEGGLTELIVKRSDSISSGIGYIRLCFIVPCGVVVNNVSTNLIKTGIKEFTNGYTVRIAGLPLFKADFDNISSSIGVNNEYRFIHEINYLSMDTIPSSWGSIKASYFPIRYRFNELMYWNKFWFNPFGYGSY